MLPYSVYSWSQTLHGSAVKVLTLNKWKTCGDKPGLYDNILSVFAFQYRLSVTPNNVTMMRTPATAEHRTTKTSLMKRTYGNTVYTSAIHIHRQVGGYSNSLRLHVLARVCVFFLHVMMLRNTDMATVCVLTYASPSWRGFINADEAK